MLRKYKADVKAYVKISEVFVITALIFTDFMFFNFFRILNLQII